MLRPLACALLFLTRIPLPRLALDARDFARSSGFFAFVGLLLALLLAGLSQLLVPPLGTRLAALVLVALWVLFTGGLHLDGLADTIDGLSGGRGERTRSLEIMRDSRIGAHGALAMTLVLTLKWAALERSLELGTVSWLMAPVAARFACTALIAAFPYARAEGLGAPFVGASRALAMLLGGVGLLAAHALFGRLASVAGAIGLLVALGFALRVNRRLGGLTGDVYGAAIELAELATLLASCTLH